MDISHIEIVVADDHSDDNTEEVISPLLCDLERMGWKTKYVYREKNLGADRNLFTGYFVDTSGKYVWMFCDDDLLEIDNSVGFVEYVNQVNPTVALCGFRQGFGRYKMQNNLGTGMRVVSSFKEAFPYLIQFPKTSSYVVKRVDGNFESVVEKWEGTLYSWIGFCVYIFANLGSTASLALYPKVTAFADGDYYVLRYSYRIFTKLDYVIKSSLELAGIPDGELPNSFGTISQNDQIIYCIKGIRSHFSWHTPIRYENSVLTAEEEYLRKHMVECLANRIAFLEFSKLCLTYMFRGLFKKPT